MTTRLPRHVSVETPFKDPEYLLAYQLTELSAKNFDSPRGVVIADHGSTEGSSRVRSSPRSSAKVKESGTEGTGEFSVLGRDDASVREAR